MKRDELTKPEESARKRVCLALDVPTVKEALSLTDELSDLVGSLKVGKQVHIAAGKAGVDIISQIVYRKGRVFLDLKLHDTPATVYSAAKECSIPGVEMFNIHIAGGEAMCKKAVEATHEVSSKEKFLRPYVIGVTVLTSLNDEDLRAQKLGISYDDLVKRRTELARTWGLDGVVCPANKAGELEKMFGPNFIYVTPGIEWAGQSGAGQKQLYTPDLAVRDCTNSVLVIGSAITNAGNKYEKDGDKKILVAKGTIEDRRLVAYEILQAMAKNL